MINLGFCPAFWSRIHEQKFLTVVFINKAVSAAAMSAFINEKFTAATLGFK
jgi:hypothetical protein